MTTRPKLQLAIPSNNLHVYIYNLRVSYPKEGIDLTFISLDDPLGVYLNGDGDKRYIVDANMTAYLRIVTSSVFVDMGRDVIQSTVVPAASLRSSRMHISWVQSPNCRHVLTGRVTVPNV